MLACECGSMEADLAVKLISVHLCIWENFNTKITIYPGIRSKCYCRIRSLGPDNTWSLGKDNCMCTDILRWMVKDLH